MFTCTKCKREFKNNGGFVRHTESCKFSDELISKIVDEYCNQNYSLRDLEKKYFINKSLFLPFLKNKTRNTSESIKIAHINKLIIANLTVNIGIIAHFFSAVSY